MAYRQLADKYATQLKQANDYVFELEIAAAERDSRSENPKASGTSANPSSDGDGKAHTEQPDASKKRIQSLEETVKTGEDRRQFLTDENISLKQQLDAAKQETKEANQLLAPTSETTQEILKMLRAMSSQVKDIKRDQQGLLNQVQIIQDDVSNLDYSVYDRDDDDSEFREVATRLMEKELARENEPMTDQVKVKGKEISKLKNDLNREKKRRQAAEEALGPEGKRRKKHDPPVIDLMADSQDSEDVDLPKTPTTRPRVPFDPLKGFRSASTGCLPRFPSSTL